MCTHFVCLFLMSYLECAKALREFSGQQVSAIQIYNKKKFIVGYIAYFKIFSQ